MRANTIESIRSRLIPQPNGCLEWPGQKVRGYGRAKVRGRYWLVHRLLYEAKHGPIPDGLVIDHLCRNRCCANLDHIEVVTNRVNILRGVGATARHHRQTHCKHGHEYTPENTRLTNQGGRRCWTCRKAQLRGYYLQRCKNAAELSAVSEAA